MSKKAVAQLFKNEEVKQELMAVTNYKEIIKIGYKKGFVFTREEFEAVKQAADELKNKIVKEQMFGINQYCQQGSQSKSGQTIALPSLELSQDNSTSLNYCYEFNLQDIQGFEILENELEKIKIKLDAVDLCLFNQAFRFDDFNFASISPASAEFQAQYDKIMRQNTNVDIKFLESRYLAHRSSHLINLDNYVEDKLYEDYFQCKVRIVRTLKNFFGADVKLTGSFWYPPNAYRLWHTNEDCVGWRMYLIDFDQPELAANGKSFFRYMHPETKELITLVDKPKLVRFFKIEKQPEQLFWHCIVNGTKANRWSYGFHVPDNWMQKIKLCVKN
ncbi:Nif11-like leader peptide family natural product precursor [Nostoc sp. FACHB-892]|uniref:Nif11-like leader peptide family natural product precursor n=1 Tax=Nostoc sp. FACHB-892 TaxID=2692843 RepID=UPI001689A08B|nr:Nif11-like leader peptide family natural product precursor [Nostoc sp. FACHB-892]MBD2730570.1 Nif11-like leader peptide family natural product precursor [Nostoc sp. FACHB-892]